MQILVLQTLHKDRSEFNRRGRLDLLSADLFSHCLLCFFVFHVVSYHLFAWRPVIFFFFFNYSISSSAIISHIGPMLYMGSEEYAAHLRLCCKKRWCCNVIQALAIGILLAKKALHQPTASCQACKMHI